MQNSVWIWEEFEYCLLTFPSNWCQNQEKLAVFELNFKLITWLVSTDGNIHLMEHSTKLLCLPGWSCHNTLPRNYVLVQIKQTIEQTWRF